MFSQCEQVWQEVNVSENLGNYPVIKQNFIIITGENGSAILIDKNKLTAKERADYEAGYKLHGFNRYVSDRISLHRSLPDIRYDR